VLKRFKIIVGKYRMSKFICFICYFICKKTTRQVKTAVASLMGTVKIAENRLDCDSLCVLFLGILIAGIIAGCLLGKVSAEASYLPFTDQERQTYQAGQVMQMFWPKLSKDEQNHLLELAKQPAQARGTIKTTPFIGH
jgi:hypothetical protein